MTTPSHNTFARVNTLAVRQLDGSITPSEHDELESLLLESGAARRAYVEYFQDTACLRWLCLEELSGAIEPLKTLRSSSDDKGNRYTRIFAIFGGIACLMVAGAIALVATRWQGEPMPAGKSESIAANSAGNRSAASVPAQVATMTGMGTVRWTRPMQGARLLSRWAVGDRLQLKDGAIELTFDAGAQVTIFGPADFEITSPTSITCKTGRVTAVVDERGKGFVIHTPRAKVVDLGTQFGLNVSEKGETEVVVFQGTVDMSDASGGPGAPTRRLRQGEALLLNNAGQFQRVVAVQRNDFLTAVDDTRRRPAEPVIANVHDNLRTAEGIKSYQIVRGGLEDDAPCFVDRSHQWNGVDQAGLPQFLLGADYIMPFNDDKFVRTLELKVDLLRPADVYVFLDNNMEIPKWLRRDFVNTGVDIGLDGSKTEWHQSHSLAVGSGNSVDFRFSVWRRHVKAAGSITLGSVNPPQRGTRSAGFNMYGVAAVAAE
jgi:hypothetical protein